ncbi:MAG: hypothetical protein SNJ83_01355 [Aggregatilineales bacterium]
MRRLGIFVGALTLLALFVSPTLAVSGVPISYHYDWQTRTLIKNYRMPDQESIILPIPPDAYLDANNFAVRPDGMEVIYCYSASYDPPTFTLVRFNLATYSVIWERTLDGQRCGLGPGAYVNDEVSFMMGVIVRYPWEDAPLALGPIRWRYDAYSLADGSLYFDFDEYMMPTLDDSVGWLGVTYRANPPSDFVFKMEPIAIEGSGYDGRVFRWDGGATVSELNPTPAKGSAIVTPWGEVFYMDIDYSLPYTEPTIPYLPERNIVRVSRFDGSETRTVFHEGSGIIVAVDVIGAEGIQITYMSNASELGIDPTISPLYTVVDIYRDGRVDMAGVNETTLRPVRVWTRDVGVAFSPFPAWLSPTLGEPPTTPGLSPSMPSLDARATLHYSYSTQSLVLNYLMGTEAYFPLGLAPDVYVNDFAIDPSGSTVIMCFPEFRAGRDRPIIRVIAQDIVSGLPYWSETYDGIACSLGLGSYANDGSNFAMGLILGYPWDPAPGFVGPYQFTYGLYSAANGALVRQLDLSYVPFSDPTQSYAFDTLRNTGTQTLFSLRTVNIEGPGTPQGTYEWDGMFGITWRGSEAAQFAALPLPNGEVFWPDFDATRPSVPEFGSGYIPPFNVVRYLRDGVTRTLYANSTQVIQMVDPWQNGAVRITLLTNPLIDFGEYIYSFLILQRDGVAIGPFGSVTGYPPTLVWMNPNTAVGAAAMPSFVVEAMSAPPAATMAPAPSAVTCPGFMPSRLRPGGRGRVTPGAGNRLRTDPSTSAAQIGLIPGSAAFDVLAGPVCDPAGRAWFQVAYSGLIGWTAEGQGSEYWTEPLP